MRFYGHFAACYGTIWLVLLLVALLTQSNVDAGQFGLWGFPIISLIYAFMRLQVPEFNDREDPRHERDRLRQTVQVLADRIATLESELGQ